MPSLVRRVVGGTLLLFGVAPLFRLIRVERSGPWGAQTVSQAADAWELGVWGGLTVLGLAVVATLAARRLAAERNESDLDNAPDWLGSFLRIPAAAYALTLGVASAGLAVVVAGRVFGRLAGNVDEMTAIIHARYWASGAWGGPFGSGEALAGTAESFLLPNMLVGQAGWVSQYPPGHLALLALGFATGLSWLVGPILLGTMVAASAAAFERLAPPEQKLEARLGGLLLVVSPFLLLMGAGSLSHLSAGAAGALAVLFALRADRGATVWAVAAGAAMGWMVTSRPWTGLTLGTALTLGVWGRSILSRPGLVAGWALGGVPWAAGLAWVNRSLWGEPLRFGYEVLYGPAHGLGFHQDPWGYAYGMVEAVAYTSADLLRFGVQMLDMPLSLLWVLGLGLLVTRGPLDRAVRLALLWALVPVAANALYWFHQPRMLFEAAPGWILATVLLMGAWVRAQEWSTRVGAAVGLGSAVLLAALFFVPARFEGTRWSAETLARIQEPEVPSVGLVSLAQLPANARALGGEGGPTPAPIVFVHTSWNERVAARFQALGIRGDSLQSLVRRNDHCALERLARNGRGLRLDPDGAHLDGTVIREHTAEPRDDLRSVTTPSGLQVNRLGEALWSRECQRQVEADRFGSVSLAPLLWQGDLPGLPIEGAMYVRDYGPEWNARVLAALPGRQPHLFTPTELGQPPQVVDYEEGMRVLWGQDPLSGG